MIEMKVMGIALDVRTNSPIVVLHDLDNRKALPIWIGSAMMSAIFCDCCSSAHGSSLGHKKNVDITYPRF